MRNFLPNYLVHVKLAEFVARGMQRGELFPGQIYRGSATPERNPSTVNLWRTTVSKSSRYRIRSKLVGGREEALDLSRANLF